MTGAKNKKCKNLSLPQYKTKCWKKSVEFVMRDFFLSLLSFLCVYNKENWKVVHQGFKKNHRNRINVDGRLDCWKLIVSTDRLSCELNVMTRTGQISCSPSSTWLKVSVTCSRRVYTHARFINGRKLKGSLSQKG